MSPETKLHPITVTAVLRKAGHDKAVLHRSGQVRGWGQWSRGFRSTALSDGDGVRVEYKGPYGPGHAAEERAALSAYADALVARGYTVTRVTNTDVLHVTRAPVAP